MHIFRRKIHIHLCIQKKCFIFACYFAQSMEESKFTPEEEMMINKEFNALLDDYAHTAHQQKVEIITKAFQFANMAHRGVRRLSGEPYIMHPLAVARIVVKEIGLGSTSICAALLHDVVEDTNYSVDNIAENFNEKIAEIVDGLTKINGDKFDTQDEKEATNIRKLVLTMAKDVRVILIKLADRLHNMRTMDAQPNEKQRKISAETMHIYAPLANRLGMFPIKSELEDLSFRYLYPEEYQDVASKLAMVEDAQMENFNKFVEPIKVKLDAMNIEYSVTARIKSVYSIWEKMQKKNVPFEDVYDLLAARIVFKPNGKVPEQEQCWVIYSAITRLYRPHPERIRDWISTPKANGYEALHVTLMSPTGQWIEVQIRSERMHELAEKGLAAHWKYKEGEHGKGSMEESQLDDWLQELKKVLEHPDQDAMEFVDNLKLNLFAKEIFVFTPNGDIQTIPMGSSVLDFAYQIHSYLGDHCIGAKVNKKMVSLSYTLKSGDQVEILTSEKQEPELEWLNCVRSAKAQDALKRHFYDNNTPKRRSPKPRPETLVVRGHDTFGVLIRILEIVSKQMHLSLEAIYAETQENGMFQCEMEFNVVSELTVSVLIHALEDIKELTSIERIPNRIRTHELKKSTNIQKP